MLGLRSRFGKLSGRFILVSKWLRNSQIDESVVQAAACSSAPCKSTNATARPESQRTLDEGNEHGQPDPGELVQAVRTGIQVQRGQQISSEQVLKWPAVQQAWVRLHDGHQLTKAKLSKFFCH